jgi:hypothetical protein
MFFQEFRVIAVSCHHQAPVICISGWLCAQLVVPVGQQCGPDAVALPVGSHAEGEQVAVGPGRVALFELGVQQPAALGVRGSVQQSRVRAAAGGGGRGAGGPDGRADDLGVFDADTHASCGDPLGDHDREAGPQVPGPGVAARQDPPGERGGGDRAGERLDDRGVVAGVAVAYVQVKIGWHQSRLSIG